MPPSLQKTQIQEGYYWISCLCGWCSLHVNSCEGKSRRAISRAAHKEHFHSPQTVYSVCSTPKPSTHLCLSKSLLWEQRTGAVLSAVRKCQEGVAQVPLPLENWDCPHIHGICVLCCSKLPSLNCAQFSGVWLETWALIHKMNELWQLLLCSQHQNKGWEQRGGAWSHSDSWKCFQKHLEQSSHPSSHRESLSVCQTLQWDSNTGGEKPLHSVFTTGCHLLHYSKTSSRKKQIKLDFKKKIYIYIFYV